MKVCGIIAEYDPFHNGHAWHIAKAREDSKADFIVCAMSMAFTQRGTPALLDAHARAEMALRCGADVVLGVPTSFTVCDAERFALGGIEILKRTGAVSALSFGIEKEGLPFLRSAAELLEAPTPEYTQKLRNALTDGMSYPKAQGCALAAELHADESVFSLPNTTLAICYLRSCLRRQADFQLFPVIRKGDYHESSIPEDGHLFASASAVRKAYAENDLAAVKRNLPPDAFCVFQTAKSADRIQKYEQLDSLLRWRLRQDDFSGLPDLSEGIENRFKAASNALTRDEMILSVKTKRYPYARISRLFAHVLLQTQTCELSALPEYAYLLGFKKCASSLVHEIGKNLAIPHRLTPDQMCASMQLDARADDLWSLGARQPFGALYRAKPVIISEP